MCGIVAIVTRPDGRAEPAPDAILAALDAAVAVPLPPSAAAGVVSSVATHLAEADRLLRGVAGVTVLASRPDLRVAIVARLDVLDGRADDVERHLEGLDDPAGLEAGNAALVELRDALWAIRRDRLRAAAAVADLAGRHAGPAALAAFTAVQMALSAIDRLEVRGRDSAGLHLTVWDHGLDLDSAAVRRPGRARAGDPLFASGSVRVTPEGALSFVYKAAAEIGELGDNSAALRAALRDDGLLQLALAAPTARAAVLGHTRWASVGIISEPNAHPLNHEEEGADGGPYVVAALNGDVDNHADLKAHHGLRFPAPITTDAKVIPALVSRHVAAGHDATESFRRTVASFEGSVAIAAASSDQPDQVLLALRGSGQALYVGLADGAFIVASEPYGLVEETHTYLRMDGETPARPGEDTSRGQVLVLDGARAGTLAGIRRIGYDGTELPVGDDDLVARRDHDPRHRPGDGAALPPEGDHRGTDQLRQDAARPHPRGRRRRAPRPRRRGRHPAGAGREAGHRRHPARRRHRPGHGRHRRHEHGRRARLAADRHAHHRAGRSPPPSTPASR